MRLHAWAVLVIGVVTPTSLIGQETVDLDGRPARIVDQVGSAAILEIDGPDVGPANRRANLSYRWFMIQDSTSGVVFRKRGGFKADLDSFDGDIDVLTTREILAIEFGVATFNIWNEFTGTWFVTDIRRSEVGNEFDLNPHVTPCRYTRESGFVCYSLAKHYTSVIWVSRVRYADGQIIRQDLEPVTTAIRAFADEVKPDELEPEDPLVPRPPPELTDT